MMWYARDSDEMPPVFSLSLLLFLHFIILAAQDHTFTKTQLNDLNHEIGFFFFCSLQFSQRYQIQQAALSRRFLLVSLTVCLLLKRMVQHLMGL